MVTDCLENPNPEARRLSFHCRKSESWGELSQDRYSCHGLLNLSSVHLQTQDLSHLALVWRPAAFPKSHLHNSWSLEELETWHVGQQRANFSSSVLGPTEFMLWISSRAGNEAACLQAAHMSVLPQSKTMALSSTYGRTAQEQYCWKLYLSSNVGRKAKKTPNPTKSSKHRGVIRRKKL